MFSKPAINNEIYEKDSDGWWDKDSFLNILETGMQPVRAEYIKRELERANLSDISSLEVGCGGGILTEFLASISKKTTGVDISKASLKTAKQHALEQGLDIDYIYAAGENLPFDDNSFDLICCCDVLEHVEDVALVVSEINRVLKPGGLFIYDTVNRTYMSYASLIFISQDFPLTRIAPKNAHVWHKFIKPKEIDLLVNSLGMSKHSQIGMEPSVNPLLVVWYILKVKFGRLSFSSFGEKIRFRLSKNKSISYFGSCRKPST